MIEMMIKTNDDSVDTDNKNEYSNLSTLRNKAAAKKLKQNRDIWDTSANINCISSSIYITGQQIPNILI